MKVLNAENSQYRIIEFLGEGLNSCVYRAFKESTELGVRFEVALKILNSENKVALWRNEFERLTQIRSRHCVSLLGWEKVGETPALILEYVEGLTLAELIHWEPLNAELVEELSAQVLTGLKDLAKANLFHGDLNLYNIMVDVSGTVKLIDFGVLTEKNDVMTTIKYAAPSVLKGQLPNFETDVFSWQCIRNELMYRFDGHCLPNADLSALVRRALQKKKTEKIKTRTMRLKNVLARRQKLMPKFKTWASGSAMAMTLLCHGDQLRSAPRLWASVSIRTQKWYQISISGDPPRFTPMDLAIEANQKHKIFWKSRDQEGQRALTLQPGQHIVLDEGFFTVE